MELITRQTKANVVVERWGEAYSGGGYGKNKYVIFNNLKALGTHPCPDAVDKVIGNSSWTDTCCNECDEHGIPVIQLGDEPDYESNTACVCRPCLAAALGRILNETK